MNRYHRQTLLSMIGPQGQAKLSAARVLLVGCGALGGTIADLLARAGVGHLRILDRDIVELTNLQRQVLFDERDASEGIPKAVAAKNRLAAVNSSITIEPVVADVHAGNIEKLAGLDDKNGRVNLIVDGTDNVETRYLINDAAVKHGLPWIYGACVEADGRVMKIRPNQSACLRCVFPNPPSAGELPTCDTAGVLGPAASVIAAMQAAAAIRLLTETTPATSESMLVANIWESKFRSIDPGGPRADCVCCGEKRFEFLNRRMEQSAVQLCGRNSVQIRASGSNQIKLSDLAMKLEVAGRVESSSYLLRCRLHQEAEITLSIFPDGRTIVQGTNDLSRARSIVSRYIGI